MFSEKVFMKKDGTVSLHCLKYYNNILSYAKRFNLKNTLRSLCLAINLHSNTFRDGGEPYIIHPLETCNYLILLNVKNSILAMNQNKLHNHQLAANKTKDDLDVLLSSMLLHDTLEDCKAKLPEGGQEFITKYRLNSEILKYVKIMTKDKTDPNYSVDNYFNQIVNYWQTLLMKIVDRTNNCSTIDAFKRERMEKYIKETEKYFYPMINKGKILYPDFSRVLKIAQYLIVSICETVASVLNMKHIIVEDSYLETYFFIEGFAIGKGSMQNTLKALPLAQAYYKDLTRKSGDPFITHPLRVCSYLIFLKEDTDAICAAALLHEILPMCNLKYNGIEILTEYNLDPIVLDYIRLLENSENYPLPLYYEALSQRLDVLLLKLSNRAHTCTKLAYSSDSEISAYVKECEKHIYPLCDYGIRHYPEHADSIQLMYYHIYSICNIVKSLRLS